MKFNFEFRIGELEFAFERLTFVSFRVLGGVLSGTLPLNFGFEFGIRALELKFNVEFRIGELELAPSRSTASSSSRAEVVL